MSIQFDYYETIGILVPGGVVLVGVMFAFPPLADWFGRNDFSAGDLGVFVILAYASGHLIQAVGNLLESVMDLALKGRPSEWPLSGRGDILSSSRCVALALRLNENGMLSAKSLNKIAKKEWANTVREITTAVRVAGQAQRLDAFNRTYGMLRGLAAALLVALIIFFISTGLDFSDYWQAKLLLLLLAFSLALYRMVRFSCHYARELFVQYLSLPIEIIRSVDVERAPNLEIKE